MTDTVIKKIRTTSGDIPIEPIQASETQLGGVKVDNDTITIDSDGVISSRNSSKEWVCVGKTISSHTITTYTDKEEIDLSAYLPDDGKQYECSFSLYGSATKSNDKRHVICIKCDLYPNSSFYVLRQMTSTEFGVSLTVPVGTPRRIYLACGCGETGFTHTVAIHFLGYKEV